MIPTALRVVRVLCLRAGIRWRVSGEGRLETVPNEKRNEEHQTNQQMTHGARGTSSEPGPEMFGQLHGASSFPGFCVLPFDSLEGNQTLRHSPSSAVTPKFKALQVVPKRDLHPTNSQPRLRSILECPEEHTESSGFSYGIAGGDCYVKAVPAPVERAMSQGKSVSHRALPGRLGGLSQIEVTLKLHHPWAYCPARTLQYVPGSHPPPIMTSLRCALTLLHNTVSARRVRHIKPSVAVVISCVQSILLKIDVCHRKAPLLLQFSVLAQKYKAILVGLASLVADAERILNGDDVKDFELDSILKLGEEVIMCVWAFLELYYMLKY